MSRKVIIDCDPGLDDSLAILLAGASPELDIIGITTVAGNVSAEQSAQNALGICQIAGLLNIPVHVGLSRPLKGEWVEEFSVHGKYGLQDIELPAPKHTIASTKAVDFLVDVLSSATKRVTLITLGPLTNIASALLRSPEIKEHIDQIITMGGSLSEGNITPFAEFNIYSDPLAAKIVFESDAPLVMVGLNVTLQVLALPGRIESLRQKCSAVSDFAVACIERLGAFYQKTYGLLGPPLHDPCAVAVAIDPKFLQTCKMTVEVETEDKQTIGRTICSTTNVVNSNRLTKVGLNADADRFFNLLNERLSTYT